MDYALARQNMVEGQIRTNRVTDTSVIEAMEALPRESFLADELKPMAYSDEDITVAPGRIMMEPMVLGRLLQAARIEPTDICLVIAASTGYESAAVAHLASAVVAMESNEELSQAAARHIAEQGADTVSVLNGDLARGHPGQAPYDVILIVGAVGDLPDNLILQLGESGRMVYVQSKPQVGGVAILLTKEGGVVSKTEIFDANIPPLPEFSSKPEFSL